MAELSLDFQNEIINETINEKRRYVMTENEDGTVSFTDVTSYSQAGTKYGAEEVIEEREAINQNTNIIGGDAYDSSKSYAAGDYFIYNNQLCKALTAISAGTALTPGTNYETTSLENEIAELNGNLGKITIKEGTVGARYGINTDVVNIDLPANSTYLLIGNVRSSLSNPNVAINAQFNVGSNKAGTIGYSTMQSGGGVHCFLPIDVVDGTPRIYLYSYGYSDKAHDFYGTIIAIRLK